MELPLLFGVAAGFLGLILGSFLNALLFRYNTGRSAMRGRSRCMHCKHELGALDLVPLLSYLYLGGRCRYCHSRVSLQYPLVELSAGVLAIGVYVAHPEPLAFALGLATWLVLLFICVYDLRHKIIPWGASGALIVLALVQVAMQGPTLLAFLAGPLLAAPLLALSLVSRGTWMGWGDGVLQLGLGWLLGITAGATALVLAFWSGAIVGIILLSFPQRGGSPKAATRGGYTMKSEVPFAPFLIFGAGCVYFFHVDFFHTVAVLFI